MMLGLCISLVGTAATTAQAGAMPGGALPADAYQEPEANGDEGYWFTSAGGFYQEPEP